VVASVLAAALVGLGALYAWGSRRTASPDDAGPGSTLSDSVGEAPSSVAVLPFVNESPDPDDEYFSDGLTEELISALSGIEGMRVPGRTSSFVFKDSVQDPRRIGEILGVGHVLEGSVRRSGEQLRIVARLVSTDDGYGVWSETYDRKVEDALEIQADIAQAIAGALELELLDPLASGTLLPGGSTDPVAYDHYLKGLYFSHAPTEADARRAIEYFRLAVEADPQFAPAWAGLSLAYQSLGQRFGAGLQLPADSKAAAETAVRLDPGLAESHLALALVRTWVDWDWVEAEREFRRAIELRPGYATARVAYGFLLAALHRPDEGIASVRQAVSLDPLSSLYGADLGALLLLARRYDDSIAQVRRTLEIEPDMTRAWLILGRAYQAAGRYREALDAFRRAESLPGQAGRKLAWLGHFYAVTGERDEAEAILARADSLAGKDFIQPTDRAALALALGDRERALDLIKRAERDHSIDPVPLQLDERLDPLRSDPRYRQVVERMGLPEGGLSNP
jgi:TolB-like protein/Tfp pilus assembly protein PilF